MMENIPSGHADVFLSYSHDDRELVEKIAGLISAANFSCWIDKERLRAAEKFNSSIDIAIDELFGNIAHYAYGKDTGEATVRVEVTEEPSVIITFIDSGIPYNPLEKPDPDVAQSLEERQIGGLGIFMVKKSMDDITYEYKDGQNILRIKKIMERKDG